MPKQKTSKTASKRIKITKGGKIKRRHAFRSHNLSKKPQKRKRQFAKRFNVSKADEGRVKRMLGV